MFQEAKFEGLGWKYEELQQEKVLTNGPAWGF